MLNRHNVAANVARTLNEKADRYDQIAAIKKELRLRKLDIFATDRETIDAILDILFDKYGYEA